MKKLIILVGLVVVGLLLTKNRTSTGQIRSAPALSPREFAGKMKEEGVFLLDVHTPEQTHIPGTDAVIPFDQIKNNLEKLPSDKATSILVYCRSGNMSAQAARELIELGYQQVYDLQGGTNAYKESNVSVDLTPKLVPLNTVVYGEVARATFTLTNYAPLPMTVTRVSTSCGCTKARVEKERLGAYESTKVNVTFDPAVHKDDSDLGDLTRTIYIETDNPNFPNLESEITATVIKKD